MHCWSHGSVQTKRSCDRLENPTRTCKTIDEGQHMVLSQSNYPHCDMKTVEQNPGSDDDAWHKQLEKVGLSFPIPDRTPQHRQPYVTGTGLHVENNRNFSKKEMISPRRGHALFSSCNIIGVDAQSGTAVNLRANIFNNSCENGGCQGKKNLSIGGKKESDSVKATTTPQEPRAIVQHNYRDHAFEAYAFVLAAEQNFNGDFAYVAPDNQQSANVTGDITGDTQLPFPERLYELLRAAENDGDLHNVVSWQPHGRCFLVRKPKLFVEKVLTSHFRQTKFTSFQRQLNLYGFKRLTTGLDRGAYYHEFFLRGRPILCRRIFRIRIKGNRVKPAPSPSTEPNFYKMKPCLENDPDTFSRVVSTDSMEDTTATHGRRSSLCKGHQDTAMFEPSNQINCEWTMNNNTVQLVEQTSQDAYPSAPEKLLRNFFIGNRLQFPPQSMTWRTEEVEDPLLDCSRFAALDPDSLKAYETKNLGILSLGAKRSNQRFASNSRGNDAETFIRMFSKAA